MAGVNQSFARCFIVFIVICILLEGALYLGLSVWGLTKTSCFVESSDNDIQPSTIFKVVMQLVYFNSDSKCEIKLNLENGAEIIFKPIDSTTPVTSRTNILFIVYACISGIWIITSVIALVGLCSPKTKKAHLICYLPFLLAVLAGCILDIVASVFFGIDISNMTTFEKAMEYLGITYVTSLNGVDFDPNNTQETADLSQLNPFIITPPIVMICLSTRVVLIWILNIIGCVFVYTLSKQLIDPFENKQNIQHFASERPVANPQVQRLNSRREVPPPVPAKPVHQEQPTIIEEVQRPMEVQRVISYEPSEGVRRVETRTLEPLKYPEEDYERQRSISPVPIPIKKQMSRQQSNQVKREPQYEAQTSYVEQPPISPIPMSIQQQLSADSPLNYRYSSTSDVNANLQGHNDEEKYGQLPWSYSRDLGDVLKARQQIMTNPNRNSDMPIIPVPDYTIHPNRRDNRNTTAVSNVNYGY